MPSFFKRSLLPKLRAFPLSTEAIEVLSGARRFVVACWRKFPRPPNASISSRCTCSRTRRGQEIYDALHAAKAARPELDIVVLVDWLRAQRGLTRRR